MAGARHTGVGDITELESEKVGEGVASDKGVEVRRDGIVSGIGQRLIS